MDFQSRRLTDKPIKTHLQRETDRLKQQLLSLGALAEQNVLKAVRSVSELDGKLGQEVIDADREVDNGEVELEEECLKILALYQPVAIDLRIVIAILKMNHTLERISDLAVNLCDSAIYLSKSQSIEVPFDFRAMAKCVQDMINGSLRSLIDLDAELAREVIRRDDEVDRLHKEMYQTVYLRMEQNPKQIRELMNYVMISKNLERMGDSAQNIAEDVIYLVEGKIIRHEIWSHD